MLHVVECLIRTVEGVDTSPQEVLRTSVEAGMPFCFVLPVGRVGADGGSQLGLPLVTVG